jgi:hypothetical protein
VTAPQEAWAQGVEAGAGRQCEVSVTPGCVSTPEEVLWDSRMAERCQNEARARVCVACPNGHGWTEEVCAGHAIPAGRNWCTPCASAGVPATVTFHSVEWILP